MKKLMFATALVASAAAFADPINAIGFEGYAVGATFTNGQAEKGEDGQDKQTGPYFLFVGDQDGSSVKAFGGDKAAAPNNIGLPTYFASATSNTNYLDLSTEGGILWRSINPTTQDGGTNILGTAQSIPADGSIYLDTLVQFTPTEDGNTPEYTADDKLVIWLNVDSSGASPVTNLMVRAAIIDDNFNLTPTNFVITNASAAAGSWYRLTIKAIADVTQNDEVPAFQIYLDGTLLASSLLSFSDDYVSLINSDYKSAIEAGSVFVSLMGVSSAPTVQAIGFKGSGALDDIVWTTDEPTYPAVAIDFTLTWASGVTPVSYTIDGGTPVSLSGETSPFAIPNLAGGESIAFTFTNADGATKTMTATAADDGDINAADAVYEWADYLGAAVNGAYTIDDANDLDMLRKGVDAGLATTGETFKQTANIDMTSAAAFAGIGAVGAENATTLTMTAFEGTYDGGNFTISNITFTNRKGSGLFNLVRGATIKDLVIDTVSYEAPFAAAKLGGAMFVGNGVNCTLQHLVTLGSNGLNNPSTYNAAGIANRLEGRGGPVLVIGCTNNAAIYGCYSKIGGICPIVQGDTMTVAFVDCANTGNIVAYGTEAQTNLSGKVPGVDGAAGILAYTQGGANLLSFTNCVNTGTITPFSSSTKVASILGYTTVAGITAVGGSAQADIKSVNTGADKVTGLKFATVDNGVATFVADDALALNGSYKVMSGNATATFNFTAAGTIAFDTALATPTWAVTAAEGLTLTDETVSGVKTYTATAPSAGYQVVIGNDTEHPVAVTLDDADLAVMDAMGVATNDVAAVNVALNMVITNGVKAWEFAILGLPPSEAALDTFKIDSITIAADGKVTVAMDNGVAPKLGRGVDITLKVLGSNDLTTWDTTNPLTSVTNPELTQESPVVVFPAITPAANETKKFYKVVVEFAASPSPVD